MDIRKFFQKPGSDKGHQPPLKGREVKSASTNRARSKAKTIKSQRLVIDEEDDDDDDEKDDPIDEEDEDYVESSRKTRAAPAAKKMGSSPSKDTMARKESTKVASSSTKKRPAAEPHPQRIEVSSTDFFASIRKRDSISSPSKKVKATRLGPAADDCDHHQEIIELMEDDTFEPQLESAKKSWGTPDTSKSSPYQPVLDLTESTKPTSSPIVVRQRPSLPPPTKSTMKKAKPDPPLKPTLELDHFDTSSAMPECMAGYTFVCTGILADLSREAAEDLIKELGGRVTKTVSGKTDYLLVGETLEDGRHYSQGKKYQRAVQEGTVTIIMGERQLYGLAQLYDNKARQAAGLPLITSATGPIHQSSLAAIHEILQ